MCKAQTQAEAEGLPKRVRRASVVLVMSFFLNQAVVQELFTVKFINHADDFGTLLNVYCTSVRGLLRVEVYPDGAFSVDPHGWIPLLECMCGFLCSQNYVLDLWEGTARHLSAKTM